MTDKIYALRSCALIFTLALLTITSASCRRDEGHRQNNGVNDNVTATNVDKSASGDVTNAATPPGGGNVAVAPVASNSNTNASAPPEASFTCPRPVPSANPSEDRAKPLLAQLVNAMRGVKTVQAMMQVTICNEQVRETGDSRGEVRFKRGDQGEEVLLNYSGSKTHSILVLDDKVEFYQPRLNQVIRLSKGTDRAKRYGRYFNHYVQLVRNAVPTYIGDEVVGGTRTALVKLTPKRRDRFESFYAWVDYERQAPVQMMLIENHSTTTIRLSDVKLNAPLDDGVFKLNYPARTRVIEQ